MTVTFVLPVYKVMPYLERCVQSLLRQTYKDFEIILVDDGSPDDSGKLCDELAARNNCIRVIHQENKGLSGARNTGIENARGEYIIFVDSDDEWLQEDGLEALLQQTRNSKPDVVAFKSVDIWKDNTRTMERSYDVSHLHSLTDGGQMFDYLVRNQQFRMSAWILMVRRQLLMDYNIFFPLGLISEDIYWNMQLWQHVESARFVNLPIYGYYHREESITSTPDIRYYRSYDKIFTYWKAQCDKGCKNADAIRFVMANLWVSRSYVYYSLKDNNKPEAFDILKKHTDVLDYGCSAKSKRVRRMVKSIGVRATVTMLGWYWQLRSFVKH